MYGNPDVINIVLVENIPQLLKHLQKTLGLISDVEVINTSMSAQEAMDAVRDLKPEVALVEYNLPDMNGINLTEKLRKEYPGTQVVLISQDNYSDIVLQAIRAGACDFITHDVSVKELSDVLKRAASLAVVERRKTLPFGAAPVETASNVTFGKGADGNIIAVYSPKGGTGTTTLAANLALALMDTELKVALVDGSMQFGDIHLMFNEVAQLSVMDLVTRIYDLDSQLIESVMLFNRASGIYIMPAPPRPEFAEKINGENFSKILEQLRKYYDFIVVNTNSFISEPVLAALDAADVIVTVTTQQINSIRNTRMFLDLWDAFGMNKDRLVMVMNRYIKGHPITVEKVGERLKHQVAMTIPLDDETTQKADALGVPFMRSSKDAEISNAVRSLAEMVRKKVNTVNNTEEPRLRLFAIS